MLVRGENLTIKYPWGNLGGQVCPLGAEKGQSLPSSALRPCVTSGRLHEPNHRYLDISYNCDWVFYETYSWYSLHVILCSYSLQTYSAQ